MVKKYYWVKNSLALAVNKFPAILFWYVRLTISEEKIELVCVVCVVCVWTGNLLKQIITFFCKPKCPLPNHPMANRQWQIAKGLICLRPIFWLTDLSFLKVRATLKENTLTVGLQHSKVLNRSFNFFLPIVKLKRCLQINDLVIGQDVEISVQNITDGHVLRMLNVAHFDTLLAAVLFALWSPTKEVLGVDVAFCRPSRMS